MCKVEMLRVLVKQRLTAAVEEIFVVLERTIAEYEEELSRTKEENERQRQLLDALFNKHGEELHAADVSEEHLPPEQQEWSSGREQEEAQPPHVKEEEGDYSISQDGEHLEGLEEIPVIGVIVKSEYDEVRGESEAPSSSSSQHLTREGDGGGSQADLAPLSESEHTSADTDDEDSKAGRTCHADNARFQCSFCDKTFGKKRNLKRHMRCHTAEKPFMCSDCGKTFSIKGHLIRHTRTHTGEKPFACSVCHQTFSRKASLIIHTRTHTGEKPFSCAMCGKSFTHRSTWMRHTRAHTGEKPYACSVCNKRFSQNEYLIAHKRTHTGEKPFPCSVCHTYFRDRSALSNHVRRHTDEKPFSCTMCNTSFRDRSSLRKHIKTHTTQSV
ncbi:gastrula zinc finger protein XlCGF64.1-like [Entelurus aequoreus]|uniref:gastrula zinc finger protein XlCGF64.1-like n=1 Tax=Entelurus aequoreus TaxID=161455 RepID=UPI002B1DAFBC|nr:gastrula zinc finger protein XlCGF64.1-like [Entelurus aequoreus]